MTAILPAPSRRRVPVPVGRLVRQPRPTTDTGRQPCATTDTGRQQFATLAHHELHDDAARLADLVRGLHHGTATLRRPDLLGTRLRRLCTDAAALIDDVLVDDLRAAAGPALHALESRPLALATPADFRRIERLGELLDTLAATCRPDPTRRREAPPRGWRARRADRALFG
ncbi:hypothetical protein [Actinomycetospora termitidis]|uniref:Uncharacterized protein n=1 Tax=Actinomycetospora termitidis TaxID=3053470 RepID=A0ABT7MA81_9PSEU|nr:hypothetical protein [Actinomycetospora sp. Odt1-22]MDL5157569.1 hypothetical protein [Actinomycetospora sp. Odt1-22]